MVAEEEEEEAVEAEEDPLEQRPFNPFIKETLGNKERSQKNSKEIAPKPKSLLMTCEATFA